MIYIFEVRDDEMCSLPCKEFNKFADAFDYAQDGLTTRIFQVPVEDGCEPCYDECKCVWDWSAPEDRNTLVRLFDGCSPSPICEKMDVDNIRELADDDYISEDDLDNDIILDEGKVLDKLKNVFSKKKKEEPAAEPKATTEKSTINAKASEQTSIVDDTPFEEKSDTISNTEEIAKKTVADTVAYLEKNPKDAALYKAWYKEDNLEKLAQKLCADPFESAEQEQKAINTKIVDLADDIMSTAGATAEENKFDDLKATNKLEINPFETINSIDTASSNSNKYADLEHELGIEESLDKDLLEGKLWDKIKSTIEKRKATKEVKQNTTKEQPVENKSIESRLDQLLKLGNEKWQEKLKLEKEFEALKKQHEQNPQNAAIISRGNITRYQLNSVLRYIQQIATEIKREEIIALTGKDPLAKSAANKLATVAEEYEDDDISDEEFLEELGKALYGNK